MFFEFEDPKWDWTPFFWAGVTSIALALIWALVIVIAKYGNPRAWDSTGVWYGWQGTLSFTLIALMVFAFIVAPAASGLIYTGMMDKAKADGLASLGFTDIEWGKGEGEDFIASREGQYFRGEIVFRHPIKGYSYQVVEWE